MDTPHFLVAIFIVRRCLFNIKSTESSKREIHQCYKKDQEMSRLNHNDPLNKWTLVLTETLPDSRGQVNCNKHLLHNDDQILSNVTLS